MKTVVLDLGTIPVSSTEVVNLSADNSAPDSPVRRRILAVSEGTHNRINFSGPEIERMVKSAVDLKNDSNLSYVPAPIVIGHTDNPLMKVGSTVNLWYDSARKAAIADIDLWQDTSMQKDLVKLIRRDPDNTYFSVRVIGQMDNNNTIHDMKLIHIANVIQPADSNAKLLEANLSDESLRPDEIQPSGEAPIQPGSTEDGRDKDPAVDTADDTMQAEFVPEDPIDYDIVDEDWVAPDPSAFGGETVDSLSEDNRSLLVSCFAYIGDINDFATYQLPHHNADGDLVIDGLAAALAAMDQVKIAEDVKSEVMQHLNNHQSEVEAVGEDDDTSEVEPNVEVVEEEVPISDFSLNSYPKNLTIMTDDPSNKIIELQRHVDEYRRLNEVLVADLEEAQRALGAAEDEISGLRDQVDVAEEKGQLIAQIKSLNLDVDEEFIQSMTVEQLQKYLDQLMTFAQTAQQKIDEAVKNAAPKQEDAAPVPPAQPDVPPTTDDDQQQSLSDKFLTGKAKVDLCATEGITDAEAALKVFGPVTKYTGR